MRFIQPMVLAALLANPLEGQQDTVSVDSTVSDSLPAPVRDNWLLLPVLAGFGTVLLVAPPALFLIPGLSFDSTRTLPDHSLAAYFVGGGSGEDWPSSWTHSENLDLVRGHLYASLSMEHFYGQERLRYQTIRAGYLVRPHRGVAWGVTVGYRGVSGTGGQNAVLVGFPVVAGGEEAALRVEPIYAVSRAGVSWTFRLQTEVYLLPRPMFAGLLIEAKPLRQGGPYQGTLALLVGVRH